MKLQVTQENLAKALGSVARVANTRGTLPVLSNVLLKTIDGRLNISATNLDIAITHRVGSKVSEDGAITIPARLMQDFITTLPGGVIELNQEDNKLHILAGKYTSVINGISADEYPIMPVIEEGQSWSVSGKNLKQALQQVVIAASNDESRPVLTGVYWHTVDGNLYLAANREIINQNKRQDRSINSRHCPK
jgi:DNA polymerase-3 subunit beta